MGEVPAQLVRERGKLSTTAPRKDVSVNTSLRRKGTAKDRRSGTKTRRANSGDTKLVVKRMRRERSDRGFKEKRSRHRFRTGGGGNTGQTRRNRSLWGGRKPIKLSIHGSGRQELGIGGMKTKLECYKSRPMDYQDTMKINECEGCLEGKRGGRKNSGGCRIFGEGSIYSHSTSWKEKHWLGKSFPTPTPPKKSPKCGNPEGKTSLGGGRVRRKEKSRRGCLERSQR